MALFLRPDGESQIINEIHKLWYDGVRDLVDGPAEIVELEGGDALIVNEEFLVKNMSINARATELLQESLSVKRKYMSPLLAPELSSDRQIRGPAILLDSEELQRIKNTGRKYDS
jgi:hypothetical protein